MRVVVFLVTYVQKSSSLHIIILCIFTLIMYVLMPLWMDGMEMVSIWISKVMLAVMGKTQDINKGLLEFRRWHSLPFVESVRDFHGSNLEFISSFVTAASLLFGLLLYDVFWVFGSSHVFGDNVMVTVSLN